jgi:hypothetical protein
MSSAKKILFFIALLLLGAAVYFTYTQKEEVKAHALRIMAAEGDWFVAVKPPLSEIHHLFDLGIVDTDGDGRLDIYTSNHNYRQVMLLAQGSDSHRDVLTQWGLDQNPDFPGWEQSFKAPAMDKPGLYIYWLGDTLTLRAYKLDKQTPLAGTLRMHSKIKVAKNEGFTIQKESVASPDSPVSETRIKFSAGGDAQLHLVPPSRGVPSGFQLDPSFPISQVFIGNQKATPTDHSFSPYLRDRHGLAWADYNNDGQLDVFISRGGVGGTLRKLPDSIRKNIRDELLISGGAPRFRDVAAEAGIEKKDCSGRHVEWTDFNRDGRIDLFINCQDRGNVAGSYPKQLYRQEADGRFRDVATEAGLGLLEHELIDFVWMDVDNDGDVDLLTSEDRGFFLYRNNAGRYAPEFIHRTGFARADIAGLKSEVNNYWRFDGKLTVADYDADGDLDIFSASKKGNLLLVNAGGKFKPMKPGDLGLPAAAITAAWVDYDNDGLMDLHVVPDGLYRQEKGRRFESTGLLAMPAGKYQAAIIHWYDRDNDGARDVLIALNENPSLWPWWKKPFKTGDDAFLWTLHAWRNVGPARHWLQIQLSGPQGNRQAIGARVTVYTPDGAQTQETGGNDGAYFSQGHYRFYFGLGTRPRADRVVVRWSDGQIKELTNVAVDRLLRIESTHSPD